MRTGEAELINIFNFRYWQSGVAFAQVFENSLMQPCVHDSEFGKLLQESLKMIDALVFYFLELRIRYAFQFRISD